MTTVPTYRLRAISVAFALASAASLYAQSAVPTAAESLARYDKNRNGILDRDELAQKIADESRGEAIVLTPFEVNTTKDVGYAAGNTLSGGRVDTPLAITPSSISVMTKEFLDDFNITDINQASAWTIGMDMGTSTPNSDVGTAATYQAIFRGAPSDQNFPTRNGSLNFGIADSYNSERFEFSRGPDASMFGDGGPGGRQGSSSKRARLNSTATTIATQADSHGGYRATLDYNKGWDRFGLRVNALRQNNKAYLDDANRIKNGITVAATVKLTKNTQFLAEFERGAEWDNLFSITNGDVSQYWNNVTVNNDNSALLGNTAASLTAIGLEQVSATNDFFVWNHSLQELINYKGNQYRTRGTGFRIPASGNPNVPPSAARSFPSGISRRFNLTAADLFRDRDNDLLAFTVEHRVGNLFLQLGFVRNNYDINTPYAQGNPNEYRVDVNRLLPDGRTNPNYLKGYADAPQQRSYNQDAMHEYKAVAAYLFSRPKFYDYKQRLNFNVSHRTTNAESRQDQLRRIDNPGAATNPALADPYHAANAFLFRYYWGDPRPKVGPVMTNPAALMPGSKWVFAETGGNKSERVVEGMGLVSQSAFLDEKIAITASIRRDDVSIDALPRFGSTGAPNYKNVLGSGAPGVRIKRSETVVSTTAGFVTYPFKLNPERLGQAGGIRKWLSPLGFVANYAENNQPPGGNTQPPLITGEEAPLTHAKTKDWGLRYSIPGGKVYLTATHYNTDSEDIISGFGSQGDIRAIWLNLGYNDQKRTTAEFNYSDISSRKLEGWEIELVANPLPNLTLSANYSHPLAYLQTESVFRKEYVASNIAEWRAGAALGNDVLVPNGGGRRTLNTQLIRDALLNVENSLNGLTTGTLANDTSNHRINFSGRYGFREGWLRGVNVVGGVNYRSHTKSGSRDPQIKFNTATPTAQQNAAAAFDYLWVEPSYSVTAGLNYNRRFFGKYQTRFQLNVSNLLDREIVWGRNTTAANNNQAYGLLAANALRAGSPRMQVLSGFVALDPRKFTFSTTVGF